MIQLHRVVGLGLAGSFLLLFLWGMLAWIRNRDPNRVFWVLLAVAQIGLILPAATGAILFGMGGRQHWLHYVYGAFPVLVLVAAHRFARRYEALGWLVFAIAAFFNFGLLVRGFMTGTG